MNARTVCLDLSVFDVDGDPRRNLIAKGWTPPVESVAQGGDREFLGRLVRMEWMAWASEQPNPKPSWLTPWEQLTEPEREVDRRIGERIASVVNVPYDPTPATGSDQPDSVCKESDGCPTEKAVLQRFWRAHQTATGSGGEAA